ncbi:hypothetical protein [Cerasicoccus fimbriatus]|uniref:hypothetical protein n=1 Tax=Cerasicoccus fimbriatus TaxID=3014554 RepID=UPI0022B4AC66|nr:hypothetical protein [Cerasicoccus sp. TK19100]
MEILGLLMMVVLFLVALWAITLCLRLGASWAGIPKKENTIGRALIAMIISWFVLGLLGGGGSIVPVVGNIVGMLISLIINGAIIGWVYGVTFGKGVQIYALALVAQIVLFVVAIFILGLLGVSLAA